MGNDIKTIRDFKSISNIDEIIEYWAASSSFKESVLQEQKGSNDVAYCFVLEEGTTKTLLTINILDDNVHLEAWTLKNIDNSYMPKASINNLLKMLGQNSIN